MVFSWRLLLNVALVGHSLAHSSVPRDGQSQTSLHAPTPKSRLGQVLTDGVKEYIEKELVRHGVRGMSIAVVHTDSPQLSDFEKPVTAGMEYANFGVRSEDGEPMTSDVRSLSLSIDTAKEGTESSLIDVLHHCIQYQSIRDRWSRSPDGGLRTTK